jgi:hypothetical protein
MNQDEREDLELDGLLRSLDHELPTITADDVMARARRSRLAPLRLAAGIVVAVAVAGVAYALPGSPIRDWVDAAFDRTGQTGDERRPRPAGDSGAGLVLDPADTLSVTIAPGSSGHIRIVTTEDAELIARMVSGEARFTSDPYGLGVDMRTPDTLELRVPRAARSVTVIAGERPVFTIHDGEVSSALEPDSSGHYLLELGASP